MKNLYYFVEDYVHMKCANYFLLHVRSSIIKCNCVERLCVHKYKLKLV